MHNPLEQFKVTPLAPLNIAGFDLSFTNSALVMVVGIVSLCLFFGLSMRKQALIPDRWQSVAEMFFEVIEGMLLSTVGEKGRKYIPFIFSLFMFILICNLLGMIPYSFTATSHIIVTFTMAAVVFVGITILGFIKHGAHYLSLFLPSGTPPVMAPLMIFIEFFAYMARPVSLSVRLAANMTAGHIVLKVLASFVIMAGFLGFMPFILLTLLTGFEFLVAALQAYIFSILTCAYLSDAENLH
jgi:F-type H+-transporting ATPase subunit a